MAAPSRFAPSQLARTSLGRAHECAEPGCPRIRLGGNKQYKAVCRAHAVLKSRGLLPQTDQAEAA